MRSSFPLCLTAWLTAAPLFAAAQATEPSAPAAPAAPATPTYPLSLDQAVQLALENSPDILVEKYGPQSGREGVRQAQGAYDPLIDGNALYTNTKFQGTNRLAGGQTITNKLFEFNGRVAQLFSSGGALRLNFNNTRTKSTSANAAFNPLYD